MSTQRHWPAWVSYFIHQGQPGAAKNSHVWVYDYLVMDFCCRAGRRVQLSVRGQRVQIIGRRMVLVLDHGCRERSEARRWMADWEKIEGLENQKCQ